MMYKVSPPFSQASEELSLSGVRFVLFVFLLTRAGIFALAYLAEIALPSNADPIFSWHTAPNIIILDVMARFDSAFYLQIIEQGYSCNAAPPRNLGFFPLYPLLVSLFGATTPVQRVAAGVFVSNLLFLGALILLYKLVLFEWKDSSAARRTVFYMAIAPGSVFFCAVYTESMFLFLFVALFYAIRCERWYWATLFAMLLPVTRMQGILAPPILVLGWMYAHGWALRGLFSAQMWRPFAGQLRGDWPQFFLLLLSFSLLLSHLYSLQVHCGDFFALYKAQIVGFQHAIRGPWAVLWNSMSYLYHCDFKTGIVNVNALLEVAVILFSLIMAVPVFSKLGTVYGIFTLASVLLPITSMTAGFVRYYSVIFPIIMVLGALGRVEAVDRAVVVATFLLLAFGTVLFANGYFFM